MQYRVLLLAWMISLLFTSMNTNVENTENTTSCKTSFIESSEPHRPKFHFSPPAKWMNDPNGMFYYQGEYHLFYQHYPDSTVWGPMHWGHAVSKDLISWEHLPIALFPDEHGYIFSGSTVVDWKNTSGLGAESNPPLIAIFTYHDPIGAEAKRKDYQTQGIAYSLDKGRTWTMYKDNPVLNNPGIEDFRDPKVFWHKSSQKWIMSLAVKNRIQFYLSDNLIDWTFASEFGENSGSHGGVWECPDLFPLPNPKNPDESIWVLLVSINAGGPNGGSVTQYFLGDFDGKTFTNRNEDSKTLWLDYGTDNYAGVTWSDIPEKDGRRIFLGWMSNWDYANKVPTDSWRNAMTFPRELALEQAKDGLRLNQTPIGELTTLVEKEEVLHATEISKTNKVVIREALTNISIKVNLEKTTSRKFGFLLKNAVGEETRIGYHVEEKSFFVDRVNSGKIEFSEVFAKIQTAPRLIEDNELTMQLLADVASAELFADNGLTVMTSIFFPNEDYNEISIFSEEGTLNIVSGEVSSIKTPIIK